MEDTIAAIGTPFGEGGVGMIRISGEGSLSVLSAVFVPAGNRSFENKRMTYGTVVDPESGELVDEAMCVFMKGPATYTTEDVAEIYCHGGPMPLKRTLELCITAGARISEPGEFTKRAFLGGRIDLSQAEAVMDVVSAKTRKAHSLAMDQLEGSLSKCISSLRSSLVDILVELTVNIDYPDEDIEELTYNNLQESLGAVLSEAEALLSGAETGRIMREGLRIAIVGRPNVGKSSIMNLLLKESRAIVTEIPGTTRDTIEEQVNVRGIPVVLTDTAGIRETEDQVESIGIDRSITALDKADLVLFVIDGSRKLTEEDLRILEFVRGREIICAVNKSDIGREISEDEIMKLMPSARIVETAAIQSTGLSELEDEIESIVYSGKASDRESILVSNARHKGLLESAVASIRDSIRLTADRQPLELIEIDVNSAYRDLGLILGEEASDDILDQVFARFCLGK